MVIAYRMNPISYVVARALVEIRNIGLVNLILEKEVVPELIQRDVTVQNLVEETGLLLDPHSSARHSQMVELERLPALLGGPGASERFCSCPSRHPS